MFIRSIQLFVRFLLYKNKYLQLHLSSYFKAPNILRTDTEKNTLSQQIQEVDFYIKQQQSTQQ